MHGDDSRAGTDVLAIVMKIPVMIVRPKITRMTMAMILRVVLLLVVLVDVVTMMVNLWC